MDIYQNVLKDSKDTCVCKSSFRSLNKVADNID